MGRYFSDVVDQAIEDIYYCYDKERAASALSPLAAAAAAGDGDASYILSRCYSGPQYSWAYHPFPEDDDEVERLIRQSIRQGSAIGVLGAMRCGLLTPEMEEAMPFDNLQQAWDAVCDKAKDGSPFCQNMIGNTYFWLDVVRIQGKGPETFSDKGGFTRFLRESTLACIPWFERAMRGGMGFAVRNLYNLYMNGEEGLVEPQPDKAEEIAREAANLGFPEWEESYGKILLKKQGREYEGREFCEKAAGKGQLSAWYHVGRAYQDGKGAVRDVRRAMECYEKGLADSGAIGCANRAGELYFKGEDGISQDYARAVQLFEHAHTNGKNNWANDMLGLCYLMGWGCQKDAARARALLEEVKYASDLRYYGLGLIYADGLGVPADIKKGVEYFQKVEDYAPAKEALSRFKKTLFGKWVRR
ncbi:MAG: sel1 repeat family protein [Lachnospiraceae bacterium]|nr:sel1 repeat family protein [Lachnospiraceae bacterium]